MDARKWLKEMGRLMTLPIAARWGLDTCSPAIASISLTRLCNSRCRMCEFWRHDGRNDEEMSLEVIERLLTDLKRMGILAVSYTAEGEIFTRRDVYEILELTRSLGLAFSINTNGLCMPDSLARRVVAAQPYAIIIGLDTLNPARYAATRGVRHGLERVLQTIARLKGLNYGGITLGAVILHDNLADLLPLARFALRRGLRGVRYTAFQLHGFMRSPSKEEIARYMTDCFLKRLQSVIDHLLAFKRQHGLVTNSAEYLRRVPEFYRSGFRYLPFRCTSAHYRIKIAPDGTVVLCPCMPEATAVGNIHDTPLRDILQSGKARTLRRRLADGHCVTCWLSCYAEENMRFAPQTMVAANLAALKRQRLRGHLL